jgi:hypothetical protein
MPLKSSDIVHGIVSFRKSLLGFEQMSELGSLFSLVPSVKLNFCVLLTIHPRRISLKLSESHRATPAWDALKVGASESHGNQDRGFVHVFHGNVLSISVYYNLYAFLLIVATLSARLPQVEYLSVERLY